MNTSKTVWIVLEYEKVEVKYVGTTHGKSRIDSIWDNEEQAYLRYGSLVEDKCFYEVEEKPMNTILLEGRKP